MLGVTFSLCSRFQSTLPARGATELCAEPDLGISDFNPRSPRGERQNPSPFAFGSFNFNPRSPRGERHCRTDRRERFQSISIHAPREGSDRAACDFHTKDSDFNPRSPRGERQEVRPVQLRDASFQSTLPARGATYSQSMQQ